MTCLNFIGGAQQSPDLNLLAPGLLLFLVNQTAPAVGIEKAVKTRALSRTEVTQSPEGCL